MSRGLRSRSLETKLYIEQDYRIGTAVKLNLTEADRRINITFNNVSCLQCAEASTLLYFTCLFSPCNVHNRMLKYPEFQHR